MEVGEKIRRARLAKGLTQDELGELLGLKKSAIAKYENGRVVNIKRSTLKKISSILGISPVELVADFGQEKPVDSNGFTKEKLELIKYAQSVPEDKAALALRIMRSIVEDD